MEDQKQTDRVVNRRDFLRRTGYAGLGMAGAATVATQLGAMDHIGAARALGLGSTPVEAATLSANDIAVLQFALNLEYLEAEFYSYAVTGQGLAANGVDVTGAVGTQGTVTGGAQVPFSSFNAVGPLATIAQQLMRDEIDHVKLIRSVLGSTYTIAEPAIKLDAFVPMNSLGAFLLLARDFEVAGVSAYGGAVTLLDSAVLQAAAQIALVEGLHAGNLQLLCDLNGLNVPPLDSMDQVPPPAGTNFFDDDPTTGLAVIRTPSQILKIAYFTQNSGVGQGGFFPSGFNGTITMT